MKSERKLYNPRHQHVQKLLERFIASWLQQVISILLRLPGEHFYWVIFLVWGDQKASVSGPVESCSEKRRGWGGGQSQSLRGNISPEEPQELHGVLESSCWPSSRRTQGEPLLQVDQSDASPTSCIGSLLNEYEINPQHTHRIWPLGSPRWPAEWSVLLVFKFKGCELKWRGSRRSEKQQIGLWVGWKRKCIYVCKYLRECGEKFLMPHIIKIKKKSLQTDFAFQLYHKRRATGGLISFFRRDIKKSLMKEKKNFPVLF